MPAPRAAAVGVMGMLAFGVMVGSLVGSSEASSPLLVAVSPPGGTSATAPAIGAGSGSSGGGSGGGGSSASGGGVRTVVVTINSPAPSSPGSAGSSTGSTPTTPTSTLPPIKHVFMIMLSDAGFNQAYGAHPQGPYLAQTLKRQGELIPQYYAVTRGPLANAAALVSGQGPTEQTAANCPTYADITPGTVGSQGQIAGNGCVYPLHAQTVGDQLSAAGFTWKSYFEGMSSGPPDQAKACRHPTLGANDGDQAPRAGDPYVTWRNPFVYFHSEIDQQPTCAQENVDLSQLAGDLKSLGQTPSLSYIVPSPCDDGSSQPCVSHAAAGLASSDAFLKRVVPEIERSPAYKADGLIVITSDEAPQSGPDADSSSCCNTPSYPNLQSGAGGGGGSTTSTTTTAGTTTPAGTTTTAGTTTPATTTTSTDTTSTDTTGTDSTPAPGTTTSTDMTTTPTTTTGTNTTDTTPTTSGSQTSPTGGGGQVGVLLISKYIKPNTLDVIDYFNHFSLLRSVEQLFGLPYLGYANDATLPVFGSSVYTGYNG